ncbi:MAG: AI-2E family transporter [Alphaproteobacteria bacterium]|jgi:predicted PurR-regulated permease PerM|nr:AI-2E family transporter [Alphaproteobacteria bacterium]
MQSSFTKALKNENFFRYLVIWTIIGVIITYLVQSISGILSPFVAGFIGAYILNRPVQKLEKYKITRNIAAALVILTLLVVIGLIVVVALPYLQNELIILAQSIPSFAQRIFHSLHPLLSGISEKLGTTVEVSSLSHELSRYTGDILQWSLQALINLLSNGMVLANLLSLIVLTPVITFYLLKDWPNLIQFIDGLLPKSYASSIRHTAKKIDIMLSDFAKGQTVVCLILMVLYATALSFTGLNQSVFVGILTGFFAFIPFIGMLIGCLVSLSIAFNQFTDWPSILSVASVFVIVPLIEANFLTPRFIGGKIGLHPVWILFALLAGGNWFGFVGILFALPIAAIIGILTRLTFHYNVSSEMASYEPK